MEDLLQQGIATYKAGKRDEARSIFIEVVKQSPNDERAWGWMYQVSNNDKERVHCMKQVLRINPANEKAKQILDSFTRQDFPFEISQDDSLSFSKKETGEPPPEITYFQNENITVTNARAIIGTKTYSMANITSVSMGQIPANQTPGVLIGLLGVGLLAFMFVGLLSGISLSDSFGCFAVGGVLAGLGFLMAQSAKAQYVVKIGSASGESNALTSTDKELIQKIVASINQAIVKRG